MTAGARSYPAEGALANGTVVEWLRSEKIKGRLDRLDRARLRELARLMPELLSEIPGLTPPEQLTEDDQRQRLFDAVTRAIFASGTPFLLVADDLQWCDRETLRFLHYLLRIAPKARLLVAATVRREEIDIGHPLNDLVAGLQALECFTEIEIGRLTRAETTVLAERLAGGAFEDPDRLYLETEGNPFFVVEALRAGWKGADGERGWISPKVQAVISSRLEQLSASARELAALAAAIGREFTTDVLACASQFDEETLVRGLDELWRRRIIREQGAEAYDFGHDKIREVAYLALSPAQRRHLHLRIAHALESIYARDLGSVSGRLALHYERAGALDEAVKWYERAAEAAQLHALVEAVRLLGRALDLLRTLPKTKGRQEVELALLTALPAPLGGIAAFWQGEFMAARGHFEAAVDLYRPEYRPAHLLRYGLDPKVICLSRLGNTLWFLGFPEAATRTRDAALALADEIGHLHSRGTALVFAAILAVDMSEPERVRAYTASLDDDGLEDQWRPNRVNRTALNGYVSVLDGQTEAGIARIQHALDELGRADHAPGMRAYLARLLLGACVLAKDERAGLAAPERVLGMGGAAHMWEAETHRLRAEFLAKLGAPAKDVEVELERALAVARSQEARSFELRAAVSLLRHRMERGDGPGAREAHDLLAAIVDGLSEGRDTHDVREAATILARI